MESKSESKQQALKVEAAFHGQEHGEELPPMRVYLFDNAGRLVSSELYSKKAVNFQIASDQNYQVMVGPNLLSDEKQSPPDLIQQLVKAKAVSQDITAHARQDILRIPITKFIWFCWWETCIVVHGNIRKLINPGSPNPQYLPLCSGTVQIFQVDLGCTLDQLAPHQILFLRDSLVNKLSGIKVDAAQVAQILGVRASTVAATKATGVKPARLNKAISSTSAKTATSAEISSKGAVKAIPQAARAMPSFAETAIQLSALDGLGLNQFILANRINLWWLLCELIPDGAFCWQELGEVTIQSDGSFWAEFCFWCPADFPDLYFEVVQNINGTDVEIYDPEIACNTYYNYDGSQSVDITITDPRAIACIPPFNGPADLYVEVQGIADTDLQKIDGLMTPFTAGTGLVDSGSGSPAVPFGGTLAFNMHFHPGMFGYYYRWSYRFDGESDFTPIAAPVTHYFQVPISFSPLTYQKIPQVLGPLTVGASHNLFACPDLSKDWVSADNYADLFFGFFDSTEGLTDPIGYDYLTHDGVSNRKSGMCTLMLELFDSAGNFVPCNNPVGSRTEGDIAGESLATHPFNFLLPQGNTYPIAPTGNITDHGRLIFRICVDNNTTIAKLPAVTDSTNADPCGFLHFQNLTDTISIDYIARHPNGYLNWGLNVYRGLCGKAVSTGANGNSPANGAPSPATFDNHADVLLGVNPPAACGDCPNGAAFAVNLTCTAWATNGRNRQSQYDSSDTIAFALLHP